ncbi:hypothetical protein D7Y11_09620 [Corallococcus sp. AB018]|nr:hypothetical protein D7Y11_09620 [Corallococcus sp. AB018]
MYKSQPLASPRRPRRPPSRRALRSPSPRRRRPRRTPRRPRPPHRRRTHQLLLRRAWMASA